MCMESEFYHASWSWYSNKTFLFALVFLLHERFLWFLFSFHMVCVKRILNYLIIIMSKQFSSKEYLHSVLLGIFVVKYAEAVIWYMWARYGSNYVIGKKFIFIWSKQTMKKNITEYDSTMLRLQLSQRSRKHWFKP